jgi:hypothetical protein
MNSLCCPSDEEAICPGPNGPRLIEINKVTAAQPFLRATREIDADQGPASPMSVC